MASSRPETKVQVKILQHSWQKGEIRGEVWASSFQWQFQWSFTRGQLQVKPALGKSLIFEPLGRFLERSDYQLEPGGDYEFTVKALF